MKWWNISGILIILWRIALILLLIIIGIVITLRYIHMLFGVLLVSVFVLVPSRLLGHLGLSDVLVTFMTHRLIPASSSSILLVPTTRTLLLLSVLTSILLLLLILRWSLLLLWIILLLLIHSMSSSRIITSMMTWSRIIGLVMLLLLMMHSLYTTILLIRSLMIIIRICWRNIWFIRIRILGMLFADGMCVVLSVLTVAVNQFKYKLFSNLLFGILPYNFNLPLLVMRVWILLRNKDFGIRF